jgi:HEAT repeat protein
MGPWAEAAVPALIKALDDDTSWVANYAVIALGKIGPAAAPAAGHLAGLLGIPETVVEHRHVAAALARIGPAADAAIPALIDYLVSERDPYATWALASMGAKSRVAVPDLLRALDRTSDPELREGAAHALGEIGLPSPEVLAALEQAERNEVATATAALAKLRGLPPASPLPRAATRPGR